MPHLAHNQSLGTSGENVATEYLTCHGYTIIQQNFKKKHGDIDIVAKDGETLVLVEVKTRISDEYGSPEDAITPGKIRMLKRSVDYYLSITDISYDALRIDLVSIVMDEEKNILSILLYKNITE